MPEEKSKRRRNRPRGRATHRPEPEPEGDGLGGALEITEEPSDAPGVIPPGVTVRRRGEKAKAGAPKAQHRPADVHPMDFWRSGRRRSYREEGIGGPAPMSLGKRIKGMHFPAWVPVATVIAVVFAILGALFISRSAVGAPRIGDHWHARFSYFVCGVRQPNPPVFSGEVHTHGDGIIHIHPSTPSYEGSAARLVKWFEYGGGKLTKKEIQMPGDPVAHKNGDTCSDGSVGEVQVYVTDSSGTRKLDRVDRYIPHDADQIRFVFGPPEQETQEKDRLVIPESEATRTVDMTVTDDGTSEEVAQLDPTSITVSGGEAVKVAIKNNGGLSHSIRFAGPDKEYYTQDDFASDIVKSGEEGFVVIRFEADGTYDFRDDLAQSATGEVIVNKAIAATPSPPPTPSPTPEGAIAVTMGDAAYEPADIEVPAGEEFTIALTNGGQFVHNLRIDGPDGEFRTADDLVSATVEAGKTGELVGKIDEPGTYRYQDTFHEEITGTVTVK